MPHRAVQTWTPSSPQSRSKAIANILLSPAVFSKSWCSYSRASKQLLDQYGANYYVIELDQVPDGSAIQSALREMNGQSTVPHIYINKQHIGGNSDLQAIKGKLPELLKGAGAL